MDFEFVLNNCHWIERVDEYHYEMYLDHHSLSTFRMCEQLFVHTMIEGYKAKSEALRMPWFFAFGIVLHDAVEFLYREKAQGTFDHLAYTILLKNLWAKHEMEKYSIERWKKDRDFEGYKTLGGLPGFVALMIHYVEFYSQHERMRPIGTEIAFGRGKEAPLDSFVVPHDREGERVIVDCYLSGRIDFLMDNGRICGPMDHKTTSHFSGDMLGKYDPQEGMTGYVYASKKIISTHFPEIAKERDLNAMWMNFIAYQNTDDPNKKFKRVPLRKSDWQLEQFRIRQLSTFEKIFQIIYMNREPDWNTSACSNIYRRDCQFKSVHRQQDINSMFLIMNQDFVQAPIWNPDLSHQNTED